MLSVSSVVISKCKYLLSGLQKGEQRSGIDFPNKNMKKFDAIKLLFSQSNFHLLFHCNKDVFRSILFPEFPDLCIPEGGHE